METMNISLAKVTTCANQIRQENNQLNTNLREITSTMQQLSNFWNSPASDTIRQRFMAMLPAFENYRTIVPRHSGNFHHYRQKLASYRCRYAAGGDDHNDILLHHRLHPDLRQGCTPPERSRQPGGHHAGRYF